MAPRRYPPEPEVVTSTNAGFATASPFVAASPAATGTTLTPPVTLAYSGASNALTVTDNGTGRGISSTVTNTGSGSSALFGSTVGTGAGLTGYNAGTGGPGGKFAVTNAKSAQAGIFATTNGTGPAILGTITTIDSNYAAILGKNMVSSNDNFGVGVEGDGGEIGVVGKSSKGEGVSGYSDGGLGVYGSSDSGYGVYGYSYTNYAGYFDGAVTADQYDTLSDKNAKTGFRPIDAATILDKVSRLSVTSWRRFKNSTSR